jgi:hypothetical protein
MAKQIAEVKFSTGRYYLEVAGIVVTMEGDPYRGELPEEVFTENSKRGT